MQNRSALDQIFVGREPQLADFRKCIKDWRQSLSQSPEDRDAFFNGLFVPIYGPKWSGKSALLTEFWRALETNHSLQVSLIIDWRTKATPFHRTDDSSSVPEYFALLQQGLKMALGLEQADFPHYIEDLESVKQFEDQKRQRDTLSSSAPDAGEVRFASSASPVSPSPSEVSPGQKVQVPRGHNSTDVADAFRSEENPDKYQSTAQFLGQALGKDLKNLYNSAIPRPICVFFDSYENIDEGDRYLREIMVAAGEHAGWVIASRKNIWSARARSAERIMRSQFALPMSLTEEDRGALTTNNIIEILNPLLPALSQKSAVQIRDLTQGIAGAMNPVVNFSVRNADPQTFLDSVDGMGKLLRRLCGIICPLFQQRTAENFVLWRW